MTRYDIYSGDQCIVVACTAQQADGWLNLMDGSVEQAIEDWGRCDAFVVPERRTLTVVESGDDPRNYPEPD